MCHDSANKDIAADRARACGAVALHAKLANITRMYQVPWFEF